MLKAFFIFSFVELQNTILPYSRPGWMKERYIVVEVYHLFFAFGLAEIFNFLPAFSLIVFCGLSMKHLHFMQLLGVEQLFVIWYCYIRVVLQC